MPSESEKELLFISKCSKDRLQLLSQGAGLVSSTGQSIEELRHAATRHRITLAEEMLMSARKALRRRSPDLRGGISRAYYSLYHTFRAVVFFANGGDDHEQHSVLPKHLPRTFPHKIDWENKLKNARLERNKADYDPGPSHALVSMPIAKQLASDAADALVVAVKYLATEGLK